MFYTNKEIVIRKKEQLISYLNKKYNLKIGKNATLENINEELRKNNLLEFEQVESAEENDFPIDYRLKPEEVEKEKWFIMQYLTLVQTKEDFL